MVVATERKTKDARREDILDYLRRSEELQWHAQQI